jgi:ribosomal-protein-alanine N-acetyltransferase
MLILGIFLKCLKSDDVEGFKMKEIYHTDRLILRILRPKDAGLVLDYVSRNKDFLKEWETDRPDDYYTLSHQKGILKRDYRRFKDGQMLRLWIFKKDDPNKVIGTIALDNIIRGPFLSCFLGYRLDRDNINQGYTTEALGELIRIAFEDMGLHRLEANIMPRNQRSLRVVEKLGFVDEGLSRDYLKINEKWEDHIHMVLLNKDL